MVAKSQRRPFKFEGTIQCVTLHHTDPASQASRNVLKKSVNEFPNQTRMLQNIWESCRKGRLEEARQALQLGADPNSSGEFFNATCLMAAAQQNHDELVSLLLSQPGITAVHYACEQGSNAPGVDLNARTEEGATPTMGAIFRSQRV